MGVLLALAVQALLLIGGLAIAESAEDQYRLGPGDTLAVTVLRHPELSVDQVVVTPDGRIQLPVAGDIQVAGKTLPEASADVAQALSGRLVSPEVTVTVKQARVASIFVLGSVAKPGIYGLQPGWRVIEALTAAGGITGRPELISGSLFRVGNQTLPLDLPAIISNGSLPANLALQPGDVISLSERTIRVSIAGQVQKPGPCDLPLGAGVVEAVAVAGGTAPGAALSKVRVQRANGAVVPVDLFRVLVLGEAQGDIKLEAQDLIIVPQSTAKVAVLGSVNKPGYFDIEESAAPKVADALAMAGGPAKRAYLNQVTVVRSDGDKATRLTVDLDHVLREGKVNEDIPLRSGDVIFVPGPGADMDLTLRTLTSATLLMRVLGF
jgi:polysaccharide export outer membrane protein